MISEGRLVRLREPRPADAQYVARWRNASLEHFFSGASISPSSHNRWLEKTKGSQHFFMVETKEGRQPVGNISLYNLDYFHRRAEYGRLLIAPEERRKGYGREALFLLLEFGFLELKLERIYGDFFASNVGAVILDVSLGFHLEGTFRSHVRKGDRRLDVIRMGILKAEHLEHRKVLIEKWGLNSTGEFVSPEPVGS